MCTMVVVRQCPLVSCEITFIPIFQPIKVKAQRGKGSCLSSHSKLASEQGLSS